MDGLGTELKLQRWSILRFGSSVLGGRHNVPGVWIVPIHGVFWSGMIKSGFVRRDPSAPLNLGQRVLVRVFLQLRMGRGFRVITRVVRLRARDVLGRISLVLRRR